MENTKRTMMKRAAMFVMALMMAVTMIVPSVSVKAATTSENAFVVSSYTMQKGEKWTLNVYNAGDKAKLSYKSNKKSVAAVSKKGVVTAKKKGNAVITVTIKEGKKTYKAKSKIKVKNSITAAEALKRVNAELNLVYVCAYDLAEMNGWLEDADAIEYLNACAELLTNINEITADADSYSEEDIDEALDAILAMIETMDELLPYFAEEA